MLIFSGHQPGNSGMGRLMSCIVQQAAEHSQPVEVVCKPQHRPVRRELRHLRLSRAIASARSQRKWWRQLDDDRLQQAETVVLMHPQTLGFQWCQTLIERRSSPTWMFVVDSSFFCIRSYNHIPGETSSCLRCLGGRFSASDEFGCKPFPEADSSARDFVQNLRGWIADRRVRCLVQTETQAGLIRAHCGDQAVAKVVGLWTGDLDGLDVEPAPDDRRCEYDVVYHAASVPAKGSRWAVALARICPQLRFLFPCREKDLDVDGELPANIDCVPMAWETGLAEMVASAPIVLVPSLWSATIEGALLKSLFIARAVAVVREPSVYSSELPEGLLIRLAPQVEEAAAALVEAVDRGWRPDPELRRSWVADYQEQNRPMLDNLLSQSRQDGKRSVSRGAA